MLIILSIISVISGGYIFLLIRNEKSLIKQLELIDSLDETNQRVEGQIPNVHSKRLTEEINRLLDRFKKDETHFRLKTKQYQEEILNISHDLRTPLTSMKGFLRMMETDLKKGKDISEYLQIVHRKVDVLTNLVDTFYDISQMESGEINISNENININQILSEVALSFYHDFEIKSFDVKIDLCKTNIEKRMDRKIMIRILTNIFQNILKYGKSYVRINTKKIKNQIMISFENDIHPNTVTKEDLDQIFNRSYIADKSRTDGSLGLGLVIVKKLMELQGGAVKAEIKEDVFVIKLILN